MSVALQAERGAIEKKKPDIKQRRVVVTGMGVVTPLGHDLDVFYNNLLDDVSGISEIERFDCSNLPTRIAGEIKSFCTDGWVAPKLAKRMDKYMLYLITAGKKALQNAGLTEDIMNELDKTRCGVLVGSAMGAMMDGAKLFCFYRLCDQQLLYPQCCKPHQKRGGCTSGLQSSYLVPLNTQQQLMFGQLAVFLLNYS